MDGDDTDQQLLVTTTSTPRYARALDVALTVVGFVVLLPLALLVLVFSGPFVTASDACSDGCSTTPIAVGIATVWGAVGISVVGPFIAVVVASGRGALRAVWPWLGVVLVVVGYVVGGSIADTVSG